MLFFAYIIFAQAMARLAQQIAKMQEIMTNAKNTADGLAPDWVGDDYNAFDGYVKNDLMPSLSAAINTMQDFNSRLGKAQDMMQQADNKGKGMVNQLADVFQKVTSS